ncbi:hypothetical protein BC940DRAFT_294804 [Gongronella butleri]|nr:hypothetical protein BC940DRAFT_294804 [Gongronella butleri]
MNVTEAPLGDYTNRPPTPEPMSDAFLNSDDFVPTSMLGDELPDMPTGNNVVLVGAYDQRLTLGRGGACTIKVGRRNRQISRVHAAIEYTHDRFELVVLGMNGVSVDQLRYRQKERAPLADRSIIDILGDVVEFRMPAPRLVVAENMAETLEKGNIAANKPVVASPRDLHDDENPDDNDEPLAIDSPPAEQLPAAPTAQTDDDTLASAAEQDDTPAADTPSAELHAEAADATPEEPIAAASSAPEPEIVAEIEEIEANTTPSPKMDDPQQPLQDESVDVNDNDDDKENLPLEPADDAEFDDDDKENAPVVDSAASSPGSSPVHDGVDLGELIIEILVFSKKSSMPISDICSRILKTNPSYRQEARDVWQKRIQKVLKDKPFFGEIVRKGKTADGSPKEHLYYYNGDKDPVEWRRATFTQVGRSARRCTLQDKQYFWRMPPKLGGRNRNAYIPPPAPQQPLQEKRKNDQSDSLAAMAKKQKQ